MAKTKQTVKIKRRVRKTGGKYRKCNMCHGTGRIKNK